VRAIACAQTDPFSRVRPYFDPALYPSNGFAHRHLSTPPEAGGAGVNSVGRFRGRLTLAFLFGALKFRVNEHATNACEWAYPDGPVRLIGKIRVFVDLPLGIKAPGVEVELIVYGSIVHVPTLIDLPFNPGHLYTCMELTIGEDHSSGAIGMRVYNSSNLQGVVVGSGRGTQRMEDGYFGEMPAYEDVEEGSAEKGRGNPETPGR